MTNKNISSFDLKRVARLCERLHYTNSAEPFSNHLFVVLKEAMPCVHFTVDSYTLEPFVFTEMLTDTVPEKNFLASKSFMHQHPGHASDGPPPLVGTLLTVGDTSVFLRTELCNDIFRPVSIKDQIWMSTINKNNLIGVVYSRDTLYTEHDQCFLSLIQPHISIAWKNWEHIRHLEQRLQLLEEKNVTCEKTFQHASTIICVMNHLTRRQRQVAELISTGKSNREIAQQLGISPRTVGKHLENIFQILQVKSRTELASQWHQIN